MPLTPPVVTPKQPSDPDEPALLWLVAGVVAGAGTALALFGAGWFVIAGAAATGVGWTVGSILAAFAGAELGCRTAAALCAKRTDAIPPSEVAITPTAPSVRHDDNDLASGRRWRDRVRHPTHEPDLRSR